MDRQLVRRVLLMIAVAALGAPALVSLSACNTVEGAGEDLQNASHNTREAIDDATD